MLITKTKLLEIIDVSHLPVFETIATYPIILACEKSSNLDKKQSSKKEKFLKKNQVFLAPNISDLSHLLSIKNHGETIEQRVFWETPKYILDISGNASICDYLRNTSTDLLGEIAESWVYRPLGFTNWKDQTDHLIQEKNLSGEGKPNNDYFIDILREKNAIPFVGCTNIKKYYLDWNKPIRLNRQKFHRACLEKHEGIEDLWNVYGGEQIYIKEVATEVTAAYSQSPWAHLTGIYAINKIKAGYEMKFVVAILNTRLVNFYYQSIFGSTHMARNYLNFHASYLEQIPIPKIKPKNQNIVAILADYALFLSRLLELERHGFINGGFKPKAKKLLSFVEQTVDWCACELYLQDRISLQKKEPFSLLKSIELHLKILEWDDWFEKYIQILRTKKVLGGKKFESEAKNMLIIVDKFRDTLNGDFIFQNAKTQLLADPWIQKILL